MTTIKDKLASSVRQARDAQSAAKPARKQSTTRTDAKSAAAPAPKTVSKPTQKPASGPAPGGDMHADPQPSSAVLFPSRVWPD